MSTGGGPQPGQDYVVRYATSAYQNGTLVLRFTSPPGRKELLDAIADYGVVSASVSEISAEPVPSLGSRQSRRAPSRASRQPNFGYADSAGFASSAPLDGAQYATTTSTAKSRSGVITRLGKILGILVLAFLGLSVLNFPAASTGWEMSQYSSTTGLDRLNSCTRMIDSMGEYGEDGLGLLFSDWPTAFPVTPPNAAFLASCLVAN